VIAAAIIGGLALLADDDSSSSVQGGEQSAAEQAQELADRTLTETAETEQDLVVRYPEDWKIREGRGIVVLESPEECVKISASSPAPAAEADQLRRSAIDAVRGSYAQAQVRPLPETKVNGKPTTGALIGVRSKDGASGAIRVTVTRGAKLAHVTSVFFRRPPCESEVPETELILGAIKYP
jgi:hypothetical protein